MFRSRRSGTKKGADWKYNIYFDPEADKIREVSYQFTDEELISKLEDLLDSGDSITKVTVYKVPLSEVQWTNALLYHAFVVFETRRGWWSIEKNSDGLTIQRSRELDAVKEMYRQNRRIKSSYWSIQKMKSDKGSQNMRNLIYWLWKKDWLNREHHVTKSNGQHFADAVFKYVSQ